MAGHSPSKTGVNALLTRPSTSLDDRVFHLKFDNGSVTAVDDNTMIAATPNVLCRASMPARIFRPDCNHLG